RVRPWHAWLLGAGAWFVMLVIVWRLLVPLIRIGTRVGVATVTGRRRSRRRRGHCPVCDYDLRGLEFSPHCPECGTLQV
ncbi:MAG: hypothetical protein KDA25_10940, partial [Phycisphaerales bacterium]|nr:hypothetical protein [Phycisphaerales bacterium]